MITLYAFILPHLTYYYVVWHFCSKTSSDNLQQIQNYAMRFIFKQLLRTSSQYWLSLLNWLNLHELCHFFLACQIHKCVFNLTSVKWFLLITLISYVIVLYIFSILYCTYILFSLINFATWYFRHILSLSLWS